MSTPGTAPSSGSLQHLYYALIALDTVFDEAIVAEEAGNVERKEAGDSITQL
ncbi:MAG TPA: hypothetical protein VIT23_10020 [Terrimicrobiaceae bacterium]